MARPHSATRNPDIIIVGGGSAGCVLANRLSASGDRRVLLLEAGRRERSIFIRMPAGFPFASTSSKFSWGYESEPEAALDGRRVPCPRGRLLGGSSAINAMAFVRGDPADFDGWAQAAGEDWSYANCLPYFRSLESFSGGENRYRGGNGPLSVLAPRYSTPLNSMFLNACSQAGYPVVDDTNGADNEGFGPMDQTIRKGVRETAASAFLDPIADRPNLTIRSGVRVTRILIDGARAVGVEISDDGKTEQIHGGEIILSAGAINSPQLLMLSGIGEADTLGKLGIRPVVDLPAVGKNMQDHVDVSLKQACSKPVSQTPLLRPHRKLLLGMQWILSGKGPGATNHFEVAGYIRSDAKAERPDVQYCFIPLLSEVDGSELDYAHGYQCTVMLLRPKSRGAVTLRSADPFQPPVLSFNYLAEQQDRVGLRNGLRRLREILAQPAMADISAEEIAPGGNARTDDALDAFILSTAKSTHHPCGTCRMGTDDASVVNPQGAVRGIDRLRVVDASIFPSITSGNINAPTMMVAEKMAHIIAGGL